MATATEPATTQADPSATEKSAASVATRPETSIRPAARKGQLWWILVPGRTEQQIAADSAESAWAIYNELREPLKPGTIVRIVESAEVPRKDKRFGAMIDFDVKVNAKGGFTRVD